MGAIGSCCSVTKKDVPRIGNGKAVSFKFSHVFAADNKGRIDDFYDISKESLGSGTNGIVYKAVHKNLQAERAVKSISNDDSGDLPSEVLILRSMDHPNIVKLYETFQDAKRTYLVMEVCSGGELLDAVIKSSSDGHFTEHQAATFQEQILAAVIYMHSNDIVHREIRAENFLLQDSMQRAEVKLIDFGTATQCQAGAFLTTKCGGSHYMAPEVLQGSYSKEADTWSCGVVLYVMLCGHPPFDGDDDAKILQAVAEAPLDFPEVTWEPISSCAKEFVTFLLMKDPRQRKQAQGLISHQFIRRGDVAGRQPLPSVVKKLKAFGQARQLKKVCLTVIAKHIPKSDVEDLRLYFKQLDKDNDGTISKKELVDGLKDVAKAAPGVDPAQLGAMMDMIDSDGSGKVDYTEFLAAALDRKIYEKRDVLWSAFRTFDTDGSGKIEKSEMKALVESTGATGVSDAKIAQMLNEADKNQDGFLDFEEFVALIQEE